MTISILGTDYDITRKNHLEDEALTEVDGYCDTTIKKIVVTNESAEGLRTVGDIDSVRKRQMRHEIVHAFLAESGLEENSWAENEEIVDWIAAQGLKMYEAWKKAGAV